MSSSHSSNHNLNIHNIFLNKVNNNPKNNINSHNWILFRINSLEIVKLFHKIRFKMCKVKFKLIKEIILMNYL